VRELAFFAVAVAFISWALVRDGKTTASRTQGRSSNTSEENDKNFDPRLDSRAIDDKIPDQKRRSDEKYGFGSTIVRDT